MTAPLVRPSASAWLPRVACVRGLVVIALAGASFVPWGSAPPPASAQPATQRGQPAPPPATPIPVPEIAQRAEDVATLLRQSAERLATDPKVEDVANRLPAASEWIRERLVATTQTLNSSPSSSGLANLRDSWMVMRSELAAWNDTLTSRATQLERELSQLEALRATWSASRTEALASRVPGPVLERINATLAAIVAAREGVGAQRTRVLSLQDRVVREVARCDDVLAKIAQARNELAGPLFARDSLPIWSPQALTLIVSDLGQRLHQSLVDSLELTKRYLVGQLARVPLQVALFVIVLVLARRARDPARGPAAALRGTVAPDMSMPALTWTVEDAGWQMGVSVATVRRLIQRGELAGCYQVSRYTNTGPGGTILRRIAWRVPDAAIRAWQAKQAAKTQARRPGLGSDPP